MAEMRTERASRERRLFESLDVQGRGMILRGWLERALERAGLGLDDPRLAETMALLQAHGPERITLDAFRTIIRPSLALVERAIHGALIIPDFARFQGHIQEIFDHARAHRGGKVADYIPQLSRMDPELFGVAICTIDGQRLALGDAQVDFCAQSCCKPINYCLALEEHGEEVVHQYVGREPSGRSFNELTFNTKGRPHNPMINAGAIMCCSLIRPDLDPSDRFDHVMRVWRQLAGGAKVGFSNATYLSERATADRNFALGYLMRERKLFPEGTDLIDTLEFYFQCCSIELDTERMATIAATLAHGGICPLTGEQVLSPRTVRHCLSLMHSCGMYDFSGEFAFSIGLPGKSGVSGAMMIVVPNVMGLCVWSPRLDALGNSVRGIAFCQRLVETFNFHNYDNLTGLPAKNDPRRRPQDDTVALQLQLIWAASQGDLQEVRRLHGLGVALAAADYDGRTALHLAACGGHLAIISYLCEHLPPISAASEEHPDPRSARDRRGASPLDEARREAQEEAVSLLNELGVLV